MSKWLLAAALALLAVAAAAQPLTDRALRIVVPLTPGGSPDTLARTLAQGLQGAGNPAVVVENRPGGNQNIGSEMVARSAPDGRTWLLAPDNVFSVNPHLGKLGFDPLTDLAPVTLVARIQFLLTVPQELPAKSVDELLALARAKPGELNYGSSGIGSPQHLGALLLERLGQVRLNHVPYKGAAPAVTDLLGGRIQVWVGAANSLLPHLREGKLRALATTASRRSSALPALPTMAQAGLRGYDLDPWLGLFAPAGVAPETINRMSAEAARILGAGETRARLAAQGIDVQTSTPLEFARFVREDNARWGEIIRSAGIRAE
jgi:tripartite-type tricarboxylate transporter receptor subunit TctC